MEYFYCVTPKAQRLSLQRRAGNGCQKKNLHLMGVFAFCSLLVCRINGITRQKSAPKFHCQQRKKL